jgi:hypothetical protein
LLHIYHTPLYASDLEKLFFIWQLALKTTLLSAFVVSASSIFAISSFAFSQYAVSAAFLSFLMPFIYVENSLSDLAINSWFFERTAV